MKPATVFSIYMDNVPKEVVQKQRKTVEAFLPSGWTFASYRSASYSHPTAMHLCHARNTNPLTVFLDIDCIPLCEEALQILGEYAETGVLIGAVQRANHINNGGHLYVGPFCMAFDNATYARLSSPSFFETTQGDVGEQLTYAWEKANMPTSFLWPSKVALPMWNLVGDRKFGRGTTYRDLFYHEFCAREGQGNFVRKCDEVLEAVNNLRGVAK